MNDHKAIQEFLQTIDQKENLTWLKNRISKIEETKSATDLYMTYSLLGSNFDVEVPSYLGAENEVVKYLKNQNANRLQIARIFLLSTVLVQDEELFTPKVANIIQVADTGELETFLKFLILLPNPEAYKNSAVEALRTNIATVFDAISMNNPYPKIYFNDQQWNQMYLKAAFMERDLSQIVGVEQRANKDLTRIISDYAHERWAASRKIDPMFWRPVAKFLNEQLLKDMDRLLRSDDKIENKAGGLCCYYSENEKALSILNNYPALKTEIKSQKLTWDTLKN